MKVGINVWRALNNNNSLHPAWVHLASKPLTEEDLPRSIEPANININKAAAVAAATAEAQSGAGGKAVLRKPTVEIKAFQEEESDQDLALRMH